MAKRPPPSTPRSLHRDLLQDLALLSDSYDRSAQEFIQVAAHDGHFDGWDEASLVWPTGEMCEGESGDDAHRRRHELVEAIYRGVPPLREARLSEAWGRFEGHSDAYHEGNRIYLQAREQFVAGGRGTEADFLELYQSLYVEALAGADAHVPDDGEAALERARIYRGPLAHAQAVADSLPAVVLGDDPRWDGLYDVRLNEMVERLPLRDLLRDVAQRTLDTIAAGGLLAARYNTYNNFAWFGVSVWKVIAEAHLALHRIGKQGASSAIATGVEEVRLGQAMLIEFFQAHQEDPAQLKPKGYWYGQEYSYLTRDLIDLSHRLITRVGQVSPESELTLPPLLRNGADGRFLEYPGMGASEAVTGARRTLRLLKWLRISWRSGRRRKRLATDPPTPERGRRGWDEWLRWANETAENFGIDVRVTVDPRFHTIAREMDLFGGKHRILFLPTHQSLIDHTVFYCAIQRPEFLEAMGWKQPERCSILARTGLAKTGVRVGPIDITMFGMTSANFDRLFEELDEFVTIDHSARAGQTAKRVVQALDQRPGLIYPMATTAAFPGQLFPLQHGTFAQLPPDVVIIPMSYRGAHTIWPKCPKGNLNINPGVVEVAVAPPLLGETTLLPRRRSLRIQLEAANMFHAIHIASLLNPERSSEA